MKSVYAALPSKTYLEVEIKVLLIIKTKILLETTHNTELAETTVTSEMIVSHQTRVGLLLKRGTLKEGPGMEEEQTYRHGRAGQHFALEM